MEKWTPLVNVKEKFLKKLARRRVEYHPPLGLQRSLHAKAETSALEEISLASRKLAACSPRARPSRERNIAPSSSLSSYVPPPLTLSH